jgi:diadenylate cyclase
MPSDALISLESIAMILGYAPSENVLETHVRPRGRRMLQKIPRVNQEAVAAVLKRFGDLHAILEATFEDLAALDGVGPERARCINEGLLRLRDFDLTERDR